MRNRFGAVQGAEDIKKRHLPGGEPPIYRGPPMNHSTAFLVLLLAAG
jgi:hypothetical protein